MTVFNQELDDLIYMTSALRSVLHELEGKTILLLGGSGFLGTAFKKFFLHLNRTTFAIPCRIISVDNYIKGTTSINDELQDPNLESWHHNVILPLQEKLNGRKIHFIINCSGNASPKQYERFPYETIDVSIAGVRNLLDLAGHHEAKIVNFSSSEVLGTPPDEEIPTTEESVSRLHSLNRRAPYDVSKLMIETLSFLSKERGVDWIL
jgi:nucleoside-diphosphate-sugar epimerase